MGCVTSQSAKNESPDHHHWTVSAPAQQLQMPDDYHLVALTSSTYGVLKMDPSNPGEEEKNDEPGVESVDEVFRRLNSFEIVANSAPRSWVEVSSVLENLKPGLERKNLRRMSGETRKIGTVGSLVEAGRPEAIASGGLMEKVAEENIPRLALAKPVIPRMPKPKTFAETISFHTVEELDARLEGKIPARKEHAIGKMVQEAGGRSPLVQPLWISPDEGVHARFGMVVLPSKQMSAQNQQSHNNSSDVRENNDSLFDNVMRASYEKLLQNLSNDEWNVVGGNAVGGLDRAKDQSLRLSESITIEQKEDSKGAKRLSRNRNSVESLKTTSNQDHFQHFERKCPPGGGNCVVLYTTSLRGIRKTYEGCNSLRRVLESFGVRIDERDVSMHLGYRNELREVMHMVVTVPRLFIKGWYIGGMEEVTQLHEEGKLAELLDGVPTVEAIGKVCEGCGGARFVPCLECSGSCKIVDEDKGVLRCPHCNENGLIKCPICCS